MTFLPGGHTKRRWVAGPSFPTTATCTGTTLPVGKFGFLAVLLPSYTKGKLLNHSVPQFLAQNGVFVGIVMHACMLSCFSRILTLCYPMDCSLPGSSIHGILQARILQWVAKPSSRRYSRPRDQTLVFCSSCIAGGFFTAEPPGKPRFCNK